MAFTESLKADMTREGTDYHEKNLKRLTEYAAAATPLSAIKAPFLQKYSPKTTNHTLATVKKLVKFASTMDMCAPVDLSGVTNVPLPPPPLKHRSLSEVRAYIDGMREIKPGKRKGRDDLAFSAEIMFLTGCRPPEIGRLLKGEGEYIQPNVFVPSKHKNMTRSQSRRYIALGARALELLRALGGKSWKDGETWARMVARATGLRHSAAAALVKAGYARSEIDEFLGHAVGRTSLTYISPDHARFIGMSDRLAELLRAERVNHVKALILKVEDPKRRETMLAAFQAEQKQAA